MNIDHSEFRRQEHQRRHDLWRDAHHALREVRSRVLAVNHADLWRVLSGINAAMDLLNRFRLGLCQKIAEEFDADGAAKMYPYSHDLKSLVEHVPPPYETPMDRHRGVADQYHRFAKAVMDLACRTEIDYRDTAPVVGKMRVAINQALPRLRAGLESLITDECLNGPDGNSFRQLYVSKVRAQAVDPRTLISEREAQRILGLPYGKRRVADDPLPIWDGESVDEPL